jgi:hypothetical protein
LALKQKIRRRELFFKKLVRELEKKKSFGGGFMSAQLTD